MNVPAPALLPIFRSQAQARILAELLLHPERESTITELEQASGISQPGTLREVNRLVACGLLNERPIGRARLISANTLSPDYRPLVALLGRTYGPVALLPEILTNYRSRMPKVVNVQVMGSWAVRYRGEPGPPPSDLDVVLVGGVASRVARAFARECEEALGTPTRVRVMSRAEWASAISDLPRDAHEQPFVTVAEM